MLTLRERQAELETLLTDEGKAEYHNANQKLIDKGQAGETDWGQITVKSAVLKMIDPIKEMREKAETTAGRRHVALALFEQMKPEIVVFTAARSIIDSTFSFVDRGLATACIDIADRLQAEHQAQEFKEAEADLYNTVYDRLSRNSMGKNTKARISTLRHAAKKFNVSITTWSVSTKAQIGRTLLDLFIESTGLVEIDRQKVGKKTVERLKASPDLEKWIGDRKNQSELLHPILRPMLVPPKPWTTIFDGGYLQMKTNHRGIVKARTKGYREELISADLGDVFSAVNALQNTAWRVNTFVYETLEKVLDMGLFIGDTIVGPDLPLPPKIECEINSPEHKAWKGKAAEVHRKNHELKGQRIQQGRIVKVAEKFKNEAAIYFPYQLDFRGRVYALPSFLNPQGNDLAKGLLEFADGKPVGDEGLNWLYIHAANCFGVDKVSYDERVKWAMDNFDRMVRIGRDPFSDLWWTEAGGDGETAWTFLAACRAMLGVAEQGVEYVCSLPVSVDGSNNGLQHFSAMLRDAECGSLVNLIPTEKPADIYQAVADRVNVILEAKKEEDHLARLWLHFGVDRKMCKRPVMIVPYGGTEDGVRSYIIKAIDKKKDHPFNQQVGPAATYLKSIVWDVMGDLMPGPREAMDWLRKAAAAVAKTNKPVTWETPSGFRAQQAYWKPKIQRFECYVLGRRIQMQVRTGDLPKIDAKKQAQSFSPNFVHSLDAAALIKTVNAAAEQGVTHFACVHDSYGTHACDLGILQRSIREEFAEMYSGNILAELKTQLDPLLTEPLPEPPTLGGLDVCRVQESEYFFA